MIKRIFYIFLFILIFLLIISFLILSTIGINTSRFNEVISLKVAKAKNLQLEFKTITFKLHLKELSLFLETDKPKLNYSGSLIPIRNLQVYVDFLSLIKTNIKIKKINLDLEELEVTELIKFSKIIKPSNFKSILNNKIKDGKVIFQIEIFADDNEIFDNYIVKGNVKNLYANILSDLNLSNTSLVLQIKKIFWLKI